MTSITNLQKDFNGMNNSPLTAIKGTDISSCSEKILNALSDPIICIDEDLYIFYANGAAEQFFKTSLSHLKNTNLNKCIPEDSPIFNLINQSKQTQRAIFEHDLTLESPKIGFHCLNIHSSPIAELPGAIVITLQLRSIAEKLERKLRHQGTARTTHAMASMLAHEIKNPLSGIKGAAQLIEQTSSEREKELTALIKNETDRICKLIDKMGVFAESGLILRESVNIHKVLDRVIKVAKAGFGRKISIITSFDPSLPPVVGDQDQLIQVFLNLIKNAAEAIPKVSGQIILKTTYEQGVRYAINKQQSRVHLPLAISVVDNGPGIKDELLDHVFEPFVSNKANGKGLGLSLVAKVVNDHGGLVEFDNKPNQTTFTVLLPTISKIGNDRD